MLCSKGGRKVAKPGSRSHRVLQSNLLGNGEEGCGYRVRNLGRVGGSGV